jgi:hypothetical protein
VEVTSLRKDEQGQVCGGLVRDTLSGATAVVIAKVKQKEQIVLLC